ncbi:MAG: DbpA RNA binding domain-containing protein [Spirochaetes bacterium]|uniref:DbpA RNA binding domain-containing protein n=1 Tax=Candidatus Ornithospirochaeta stercoripullorum TaxID=2840899 RepID=A0A9D9DZH9_9SPIO|nr:DbpA RNA binding domain-containing protein [Candidatus Ornithospirochaeta stercoripullorum]
MEERTSTPLSGDAMERKIDELLQAVRSADPAELESIKSLIRKKVKFFDRMSLAAILLKTVSEGRKREERAERKPRQEKKPIQPVPPEREEQKEKVERVFPEGAKTLYLNIGKMKHLYAKDLSKLLQTELGITRDDIYQIRVHDKYSFVTMSEENCQKAIDKLNNQTINGRNAKVTYSEK